MESKAPAELGNCISVTRCCKMLDIQTVHMNVEVVLWEPGQHYPVQEDRAAVVWEPGQGLQRSNVGKTCLICYLPPPDLHS